MRIPLTLILSLASHQALSETSERLVCAFSSDITQELTEVDPQAEKIGQFGFEANIYDFEKATNGIYRLYLHNYLNARDGIEVPTTQEYLSESPRGRLVELEDQGSVLEFSDNGHHHYIHKNMNGYTVMLRRSVSCYPGIGCGDPVLSAYHCQEMQQGARLGGVTRQQLQDAGFRP